MTGHSYKADVIVAGGGIAGIVTAIASIDAGKRVILFDKDSEDRFGGLAKLSFGGVMMVGTPHQRRAGIPDSPDLAYADWLSYAEFGADDALPREWARFYCDASHELIYRYCDDNGIAFLPVVNWPERGADRPGNSVPRWHITWGTGHEIIVRLLATLESHPRRDLLELRFGHEVSGFQEIKGRVTGVHGRRMDDDTTFEATADHVVVASGGICGGDLSKVRANWHADWGEPPEALLNGAHRYGDGMLHDRVQSLGGRVTHLNKQWHYAAGVHHPAKEVPNQGLSLVPPRGALWVNAHGERIRNPGPIVPYTDTRHLVESICRQPGKYSWQIMNWKIAVRELAVSGCSYMTAFLKKSKVQLVKGLLLGNRELVERLLRECPDDFVTADSVQELVDKMNERNLFGLETGRTTLEAEIDAYDAEIARGPRYFNDEQLRRIAIFRGYRGDKVRMCKFQPILDPKARPLIAIREFVLSRKSLGGIQTNLDCEVIGADGNPVPGLYAVGEAAGFGGGGIHGLRSLEGTFLGGCILTGRVAGKTIASR